MPESRTRAAKWTTAPDPPTFGMIEVLLFGAVGIVTNQHWLLGVAIIVLAVWSAAKWLRDELGPKR